METENCEDLNLHQQESIDSIIKPAQNEIDNCQQMEIDGICSVKETISDTTLDLDIEVGTANVTTSCDNCNNSDEISKVIDEENEEIVHNGNENNLAGESNDEWSAIVNPDVLKFDPTAEDFSLFEIGRATWKSDNSCQRYLRGCLWSPDGTCVLTSINGEGMQVFELPSDLYQTNVICKSERELNNLVPPVIVPESGTVYDYNWFPQMNSNDPSTCCWIASRQHEPMHMWDAFTGELRGTYRGYDQFDEVETAISCIFSAAGDHIIGGYKKSLKVFQTNIPGRDYIEIKSKNAVSALTMHYNHSDMIISGSWNSTINIYDIRATNLGCLTTIPGHSGGVTLLKFDSNGEKLFSGARKDNFIFQWDLRNFKLPVEKYERNVETNQRIYFDISVCGKYLLTGGTNGVVKAWNISSDAKTEYQFNLHYDCCNGVGFSAIRPVMCSTSGQYKFTQESTEAGIDLTNKGESNHIDFYVT